MKEVITWILLILVTAIFCIIINILFVVYNIDESIYLPIGLVMGNIYSIVHDILFGKE